jgi:hypothetical protein
MLRRDGNRMKQRLDRVLSLRSGVVRAATGLALMSAVLAGCASATIDDAVPTALDGPRNTGTFPNLNVKPQVATEQITPEEKTAQIEAIQAARQQQAAAGATGTAATDPVLLRKLAATHADDTLKAIEAQK